jgi:hypothetical protein
LRSTREVRDLLGPADPALALGPVPPAAATAGPAPRRRAPRRTRRLVIAVAALTVAASAALAVVGTMPGNGQAYALTPAPLPMTENGPAAGDTLRALADTARTGAADPQSGAVDYLRQRAWAEDAALDGDRAWTAIVPFETRIWRRPDGSGRISTTWLPPERTYPDPLPLLYRWQLPSGTDTELFPAGRMFEHFGAAPPAADAAGIRAQVYERNPEGNGPKSAVQGVADLYRYWPVGRDARVAILRFLAQVPQLRDGGPTADRSGRPGVAVYAEQGGVRYTLVFDATTGGLLAYEMTFLVNPGKRDELRYPAVVHYVTFLEAHRVAAVPG